jgi:hypothetical protein
MTTLNDLDADALLNDADNDDLAEQDAWVYDIKVFQTGRHYSDKGQRIAYTWDNDNIYFVDVDRGIDGVYPNALHEKSIPHWQILGLYDHGNYRYFERDELHIRDELTQHALYF